MLLLCVSVPSFMINLDANIVAVSLSSIGKSLHADFGLVMIGMTIITVTESFDPHAIRVDVPGVLTFSGFLGLLTWALILGNRIGWNSGEVRLQLAGSAVLLAAFLIVEARQSRPMVDLRMF
jgi:hypothetical protein